MGVFDACMFWFPYGISLQIITYSIPNKLLLFWVSRNISPSWIFPQPSGPDASKVKRRSGFYYYLLFCSWTALRYRLQFLTKGVWHVTPLTPWDSGILGPLDPSALDAQSFWNPFVPYRTSVHYCTLVWRWDVPSKLLVVLYLLSYAICMEEWYPL